MAVLLAGVLTLAIQVVGIDLVPEAGEPPVEETVETPVAEEVAEEEPEPPPPPLTPRQYLYATYPSLARRLDCIIRLESSWFPGAVGYRGRYIGLAQFDLPTWYETPQGRSGASRYDPYASIDAMAWGVRNLGYGRWPVTSRRC